MAETEEDEENMNREYEEKIAEFNKRQEIIRAANTFNDNIRIGIEKREKEREKEEAGKRKLKPQVKVISKKRLVES